MSGSHIFILAIIALTFGYALLKAMIGKQSDSKVESPEGSEEMMARIDVLEDRIRVLERIVTEGNHDLKREIDQL